MPLIIRYKNKKSRFAYPIRKSDWVAKVYEHLSSFGCEMILDPNGPKPKLDGTGFVRKIQDFSNLIIEWVENIGTEKETVETLTLPPK